MNIKRFVNFNLRPQIFKQFRNLGATYVASKDPVDGPRDARIASGGAAVLTRNHLQQESLNELTPGLGKTYSPSWPRLGGRLLRLRGLTILIRSVYLTCREELGASQ